VRERYRSASVVVFLVIIMLGFTAFGGEKKTVAVAYPTGDMASSVILVEKSVPIEAQVGAPFEYELKVTNLTAMKLEDVVVKDVLSADFQIADPPEQVRVKKGMAEWLVGSLNPRQAKAVQLKGLTGKPGVLSCCATVTYKAPICITIDVVQPKLKLVKTGPAEVLLCDPILYKFVVTNVGTGVARNVKIQDGLPEGLMTRGGEKKISFDVGQLNAGESKEYSA